MTNSIQAELEKLRTSLAGLEAQRASLGAAIVEPALAALRQQLAALQAQAAPAAPATERRLVTILFSDVVGSVTLAEKLDPEDWRDALAQVQSAIGQIVTRHQGMIGQYQGDALVAFFGARMVSEADPENAIRAGLAAQSATADLKASGALKLASSLDIRVGIHTGLIVLGEWGTEAKIELGAFGDAVNVAARLQTAAPPGGVLISHETYRYVRGVFDVTPQPLITLKGRSQPTQTYVVHRAKPRPFRTVTRGVAGVETLTIGREVEQQQIVAAFRMACQERKVVWVQLVGEPGVGKSRLLSDTMEYLALQHQQVGLLKARAFPGDERQAFGLVRRAWFDRFQIAEDAPLAEAEAKWQERFLGLRGAGFEEAAHALGLLAGLPFQGSPHIGAMRHDPVQVKGRAIVVSRDLLAALRDQVPIVVLLEDLHWADAASWEYLTKVILEEQAGLHGMFVLATARPEWNPPAALLKYPDYYPINLAALSETSCQKLVTELLRPVDGVPDQVRHLIAERSEGVPYFAEELVNWLVDGHVIDQRSTPWRFDATRLKDSMLPGTLQHLLFARLNALTEDERLALQCGAIFGRNFWEGGLAALGAGSSSQLLGPLQPRGFVEAQPESSFVGENEWSFHHGLLQQVAYESVLKRDRQKLHKAAAAWLEVQSQRAGRLDELVGIIGEHAERAGELAAAADWYLRAGERAKTQGAFIEAARFFDQVLELVPPADRERHWRATLGRNDVAARLGEKDKHRASISALLELADGLEEFHRATTHYRLALYLDHDGNYRAAVQEFDVALASAHRAGDVALETSILGAKLICQHRLGDVIGAAATARAVSDCAGQVDPLTAAKALNNLAVYCVESGDLARALQLHGEQADIHRRLGDRSAEANALLNQGYDYVCLGMPVAGRAALEQSLKIYHAIGVRREMAYGRLNLGLAYWRNGDLDVARQLLEQMQSELAALGDPFGRAAGLAYLALVREQSNDVGGAIEYFAQARELYGTIGVQSCTTDALAGLARGAMAQGNFNEAREHASAVWEYLQQQGAQGMEFPIRAFLTCADIFGVMRETERSRAAIEEGYHELIRRADKISHADWRRSFLENVPEHRAITERWKQLDPIGRTREGNDHVQQ